MKYLFLIIGLVILSILQSALAQNFAIAQVFANLLLVFAVTSALYGSTNESLIISLAAGSIIDYISALPDGVFVIAFLVLMLIVKFASRLLSEKKENILALAGVLIGATTAYYILVSLLSWNFHMRSFWIEAVLNLIVFYPIYLFYTLLTKLALKYESK